MTTTAEAPADIPAEEKKRPAESPLTERDVKKVIHAIEQVSSAPIDAASTSPTPLPELGSEEEDDASYYWHASTMAPLNTASAAAIARLRAFKPPAFPLWDRLPVSRRAAVLLLLYADRRGHLRVVITMRAASLRSFSGHAALPGGKADSLSETPYQVARREAWEEIGLPMDDTKIPAPFRIEHLCYLPYNLAKTELVVRPCVAFLHVDDPPVSTASIPASLSTSPPPSSDAGAGADAGAVAAAPATTTVEESLIPRLDAKEVAAVFTAPFHNFLRSDDEAELQRRPPLPPGAWYEGSWVHWNEQLWRLHYFYVPVNNQHVTKPRPRDGGLAALAENGDGDEEEEEEEEPGRYKVWGMTARIIVDAATVAYGEEPEFEHNSHFGDERMIEGLEKIGRLGEKKKYGGERTSEVPKPASAPAKM